MNNRRTVLCSRAIMMALILAVAPVLGADDEIRVLSADPPVVERDTMALDVTINGSGFAPDSQVEFYVTGTCNPGGILVNWVRYEGGDRLIVNVDVAADAATSAFDVYVRAGGRTGKGTELFKVTLSVNVSASGPQSSADVAIDEQSAVFVWRSEDGSQAGSRVLGRRFDLNGEPVDGEFEIATAGRPSFPKVGVDGRGSFVVAWIGDTQEDSATRGVFARRFDASGEPIGDEFRVDYESTSCDDPPDLVVLPGGDFIIVWTTCRADDRLWTDIRGRLFDSSGIARADSFQINSEPRLLQQRPVVAVGQEGDFVVAWTGLEGDVLFQYASDFIYARRFQADGSATGTELKVAEGWSGSHDIAIDAAGGITVVWANPLQAIWLKHLDADLQPTSSGIPIDTDAGVFSCRGQSPIEQEVSAPPTGCPDSSRHVEISLDSEGEGLVAWHWIAGRSEAETPPHSYDCDMADYCFNDPLAIIAIHIDSEGSPVGDRFVVSPVSSHSVEPAVAMEQSGRWAIAWTQGWPASDIVGAFSTPGCSAPTPPNVRSPENVSAGEVVTLSVSTTGTDEMLYQWYQDDNPVQTATSPNFTTAPLSESTIFRVEVTSRCGTTSSEPVTVFVGERRRGVRR